MGVFNAAPTGLEGRRTTSLASFQKLFEDVETYSESTVAFFREFRKPKDSDLDTSNSSPTNTSESAVEVLPWSSDFDLADNIIASPESKSYGPKSFSKMYLPSAMLSMLRLYKVGRWTIKKTLPKACTSYVAYKMYVRTVPPYNLRSKLRLMANNMAAELLTFARICLFELSRLILEMLS